MVLQIHGRNRLIRALPHRLICLLATALVLLAGSGCSRKWQRAQEAEAKATEAEQKEAAAEAATLIVEFEKSSDEADQIEIAQKLAINASPAARASLERIYRATPSPSLKTEIIQALALVGSDNLEPSLILLRDALAPGQPAELREAAIGTLRDLNDPATLPVWKLLLRDPDADLREAAQQAVEYYSIFEETR
jgi:HEAT repeat protein